MDAAYEDACQVLSSKPPSRSLSLKEDTSQAQMDYYATVRTNVVLAWTLTNVALVIVIINLSHEVHNVYMAVLFYSVAALAFFRLLGAIMYMYVQFLSCLTFRSHTREL